MENIQNDPKKEYDSKREQAKREQEGRERRKSIMRALRWVAIVGGMFALIVVLVQLAEPKPGATEPTRADVIGEGEWTSGSRDAKVVLVEYSDFQCPACASYYPVVKQLKEEYGDRLLFAYRNFPLSNIHQNARPAAFAAGAAGAQGKFWEMHYKLCENQSAWSSLGDPGAEFLKYAQEIGLDIEAFKRDINSEAVQDKVDADYASGERAKVRGTPTFFINGISIENPRGYDSFKAVLDQVFQVAGQ